MTEPHFSTTKRKTGCFACEIFGCGFVTCRTSSVQTDFWKSPHPFFPSGSPTFSASRAKAQKESHFHSNSVHLMQHFWSISPEEEEEEYLLHQYVPPVQDGDAQLEGESHHGAEPTWWPQITSRGAATPEGAVPRRRESLVPPLLALIIWSTISAAPRSCSLACWYSIFCFSISFSCGTQRSKHHSG